MVSCGDTETSSEVVDNGPEGSLPKEWSPDGLNAAEGRNTENEENIEPVDVFEPVLLSDGLFGDVRLLGIVLWVPVRLRLACLSRRLLGLELRLDGKHASSWLVGRHNECGTSQSNDETD